MRIRWGNVILVILLAVGGAWLYSHRSKWRTGWSNVEPACGDRNLMYILIAAAVLIAVCALQRWRRS